MTTNQPSPVEPAELTDQELLRSYNEELVQTYNARNYINEERVRAATIAGLRAVIAADRARRAAPARLRHCPTHGQQPPETWGCPECLRELREERAAAAPVEPVTFALQWSENMPPCEECRYDHCKAETPFGSFLITWKSWKEYDSPTVDETPWGDSWEAFATVELAKAACQREFDARLALCGLTQSAPAEPADDLIGYQDFTELCARHNFQCDDDASVETLHELVQEAIATDRARRAAPPAEGEVGELVAKLRRLALQNPLGTADPTITRAADLLQQQAAELAMLRGRVAPVAVAKRLPNLSPQGGDFNDAGLLWWFIPNLGWRMCSRDAVDCIPYPTHWLPFHALPLPAGEVEA